MLDTVLQEHPNREKLVSTLWGLGALSGEACTFKISSYQIRQSMLQCRRCEMCKSTYVCVVSGVDCGPFCHLVLPLSLKASAHLIWRGMRTGGGNGEEHKVRAWYGREAVWVRSPELKCIPIILIYIHFSLFVYTLYIIILMDTQLFWYSCWLFKKICMALYLVRMPSCFQVVCM